MGNFGWRLGSSESPEDLFALNLRFPFSCLTPDRNSQLKLLWHCLMCLASSVALAYTAAVSSEPKKYLIFLTSWGLVASAAAFALQLANSVRRYRTRSFVISDRKELSLVEKTLTFLLNVISAITMMITVFYWTLIFPTLNPQSVRDNGIADKLLGHGLIPLLVMTDLVVFSTRRLLWQHLWHPLAFGLAWVAFSGVYHLCGGRGYRTHHPDYPRTEEGMPYVYKWMDWTSPWRSLGIVGGIGACVVVIHLLLWSLDWSLARWCQSERIAETRPGHDETELQSLNDASFKVPIEIISKKRGNSSV